MFELSSVLTPRPPASTTGHDTELQLMKNGSSHKVAPRLGCNAMVPSGTWTHGVWPHFTRPSRDARGCPPEAGWDPSPGEAASQCAGAITWLGHTSSTCGEGNPYIMETPHNTMWKSNFKNRFYFHFEAKENSWSCFSLLVRGRN